MGGATVPRGRYRPRAGNPDDPDLKRQLNLCAARRFPVTDAAAVLIDLDDSRAPDRAVEAAPEDGQHDAPVANPGDLP